MPAPLFIFRGGTHNGGTDADLAQLWWSERRRLSLRVYGDNPLATRYRASVSYASSNTLVGGGSTLPAIGYVGNSTSNPVYPAGANSLFGVFSAQAGSSSVSYCKTSDSVALGVLSGGTLSGYGVQGTCPTKGLGAGTVGRSDLTQPNYVVLDVPLSATDISNYHMSHGSAAWPMQFPALAGPIAIAFNLKDNTGAQATSSEVNLSDMQICDIFSGVITNWSDSSLTSAFTLPAGHSIPSNPINVQCRSDGTGTTFSLGNHLANVCGIINNHVFETNQAFTSVVAKFFTMLPSNWAGSNGNASVATAIGNTASSLGYVETTNASATNPGLQFADVNGKSPIVDFGSPLTITGSTVVYNEVISSTNNANGTAALVAIANPPSTQCIALVPPADYAIPGSTGGIVPSTSYPIVAITYLLGNAQGNGITDLANSQNLVNAPYNSTITGSVTTIGGTTGLAFLTLGTGAFSATAPGNCLH